MIVIEWSNPDKHVVFTRECKADEVLKVIEDEKINLQEATIKMRCRIPGIAFEALVEDVKGSGGKVL